MNPSNSFSTKATTGDSKKSMASLLFDLDPDDKSEILVYKYRAGAKALQKTSESDLVKELDADPVLTPYIRVTKKKIPRGDRSVEIHQADLMDADEIAEARDRPLNSSVAAITLSTLQKVAHQLLNKHEHLYVVSKSIRPSKGASRLNTAHNSPDSSKEVSPTNTFPANMR